ncbi:TIGR03564 family F420-dependent LLM class oxidoreductase [Kribbella capetownensis]|uniref:TIGR03564 family F420-dependent LLM class oxidoreductase n=1 Tax=Kribbella capetownensis TaxID=1572659 RepID=A0A4R0J6N0_9ACTN|nr:TIGR03564 family F420-dependent LLM class oxidoreductase [Kribbella capetownensis]TCC40046.1 TIGR03564 family F420-dependent LLM class oxidoreductase [Kribbella capetownensis]
MRIGLAFGDVRGQRDLAEITRQIRATSGTAWISQGPNLDALTTLAVAGDGPAEIGTAVVPVAQRHPLVLASQALTAQAATGNRLILGIGAGISRMVDSVFGLPTDRPARRLREYLEVLRPLLRGEPVDHHGETLTAVGAVSVDGAVAPPVLVAALGPAMLRVAGELADGTITWMTGPRTLASHVVPSITRAANGRTPRIVAGLAICVTAEEDAVRGRFATDYALAGQVPEYRAMLDREGVNGPADVLLAGDEDAIAKQLDQLRDTGITDLMLAPIGPRPEQAHTVELLRLMR